MTDKNCNMLKVAGGILISCASLAFLSYWFFDRAIVIWACAHHLRDYQFLDWFTQIPVVALYILMISTLVLVVRFCCRPLTDTEWVWLGMFLSAVIADKFTDTFKIIFGRYWAETWTHNNPSFLHDGVYGCNWFHTGSAFKSFPSGHTTITIAIATVLWLKYPKFRPIIFIIALLPIVGLVGMYYHYLADIFGGIAVGSITGYFTVKFIDDSRNKISLSRV